VSARFNPRPEQDLFHPRAWAVVGVASAHLVAAGPLRNLWRTVIIKGGIITPQSTPAEEIRVPSAVHLLRALPEVPDTVVITVPAAEVCEAVLRSVISSASTGVIPFILRATKNPHTGSHKIRLLGPRPSAW